MNRARGLVLARRSASQPPTLMPAIAAHRVTRPRIELARACSIPRVLTRKVGNQTSSPPMAKV